MKKSMNLKPKDKIRWQDLINKKFVAVYLSLALVLMINQLVFSILLKNRELAMAAAPTFTLTVLDLAGSNNKILVTFSEAVTGTANNHTPLDASDFTVVSGSGLAISAVDHIVSTKEVILTMNGPLSIPPGDLTITCAPFAVYDDGHDAVCTQSAMDVAGATLDAAAPALSSWDLDMNAGTLTMNFSEAMDFSVDVDETKISIQDAMLKINPAYTLTTSTGTWTNSSAFVITLSAADLNALKADPNLANTAAVSFISLAASSGLVDAVQNTLADIADGAAVQVDNYIADATKPLVSGNNLNTDFSGCTNPGTAYCDPGDTIIFTWDNSALGDNPTGFNGDIASVSADLSPFGGNLSQAFSDPLLDGNWTYTYTVSTAGTYSGFLFHITATDYDVGNVNIHQCGKNIVCSCADKVIADYTLTANLNCLTGGNGLIIDKDGITIDGSSNNYTILGTYATPVTDLLTGQHGILNLGHSNITIKNLVVKDFFYGIVEGSLGAPLTNITIEDSSIINTTKYDISFIFPVGILIGNSDTNIISGNTVTGYQTGIGLTATANNNISSNIVSANVNGIDLGGILPGALLFNSTVADNIIKLSNSTALSFSQIAADPTVIISDNTFLYNQIDIGNATDDVGVIYDYSDNKFSHNINNRMIYFASEPVTRLQLGDTANFVFELRDEAGRLCPACGYTIETSPGETVSDLLDPFLGTVTGSFVPSRYGIYTLQITVTGSNGNIGKRNIPFYVYSVGGTSDLATAATIYYYRPQVDSIHGQPKGGDARSLLLTPPTEIESETCSQWVINFIDELPPYPFGSILEQDFNFWHKAARHSKSYLSRFWGASLIEKDTLIQNSEYVFDNVNYGSLEGIDWNMDYPYSWYHPVIEFGKPFQGGTNPFIQSHVPPDARFSTATITHTYTTTPAIKYFSDSDVLLLAANPSVVNPALYNTLILDGTNGLNHSVNVTLDDYKYPFSAETTRLNPDGTATLMVSNITTISSFDSVNMAITPTGGSVDVAIDTWQTSGDYYKKWTEDSTNPLTSANHIVGDLLPGTEYSIKVNGRFISNLSSNGSGEIDFNYSSYDSLKTFEVGKPVHLSGMVSDTIPPGDVSNLEVKADSSGNVTLTWEDPTDQDLKEIVIIEMLNSTRTETMTYDKDKKIAILTNRVIGYEYEYLVKTRDLNGLESSGILIKVVIPSQGEVGVNGGAGAELTLPAGIYIGDLLKSPVATTVYFVDADKRRHAFPNEPVYFTYFTSFKGIKIVPISTLAQIEIGHNVTANPGTWLVKIQSDPKVYAVEPYGLLRNVSSNEIATRLYGLDWTNRVMDVAPSFFPDYQVGSNVNANSHPNAAVIKYRNDSNLYYIEDGKKRLIPPAVFINNKFQNKFILENFEQTLSYPDGEDLASKKIEDIIDIR